MAKKKKDTRRFFARNKKARYEYFIEDTFEAGIALVGSEVKSIREGRASLNEAYVMVEGEEVFLVGAHVAEWPFSHMRNHDPVRRRKLLLHKREILRLKGKVRERGYTLVPLALYPENGRIKLEVGLARGKRKYDKREAIKRKDQLREQAQERAWERRRKLEELSGLGKNNTCQAQNVENFKNLHGGRFLTGKTPLVYSVPT